MSKSPINVLVLCTGNSARSQMAEGFLRKHGLEKLNAYSAGTDPKGVHPLTIEVMREAGVDLSAARSKNVDEFLGAPTAVGPASVPACAMPIDYLIVVCHAADTACPAAPPGVKQRLYWPFEDPAACHGTREEKLALFRKVRDQIEARVSEWILEL